MKESLLLIALKKELAAYEQNEQPFYISKSSQLQANINILQLEIEKIESILMDEIKNSELLDRTTKKYNFRKVNEMHLQKSS